MQGAGTGALVERERELALLDAALARAAAGEGSLRGCLWRAEGKRHAFSGWTGLAAALTTAIEEGSGNDDADAGRVDTMQPTT
jgi:hypothetical protein